MTTRGEPLAAPRRYTITLDVEVRDAESRRHTTLTPATCLSKDNLPRYGACTPTSRPNLA
jgi:hypothetical protein